MYEYFATIQRVVDADTLDLKVDLGFYLFAENRFRLARIDAFELGTAAGKTAKEFVKQFEGKTCTIQTSKNPKDKYGRYLAEIRVVFNGQVIHLNDYLVDNGYAVPYGVSKCLL